MQTTSWLRGGTRVVVQIGCGSCDDQPSTGDGTNLSSLLNYSILNDGAPSSAFRKFFGFMEMGRYWYHYRSCWLAWLMRKQNGNAADTSRVPQPKVVPMHLGLWSRVLALYHRVFWTILEQVEIMISRWFDCAHNDCACGLIPKRPLWTAKSRFLFSRANSLKMFEAILMQYTEGNSLWLHEVIQGEWSSWAFLCLTLWFDLQWPIGLCIKTSNHPRTSCKAYLKEYTKTVWRDVKSIAPITKAVAGAGRDQDRSGDLASRAFATEPSPLGEKWVVNGWP